MSVDTVDRIAREVGVTRRTVQRVLAQTRTFVRPTLRARAERITALGRELGYRPNAAARAVSTGRFGQITLVLSARGEARSRMPESLLQGIYEAAESHRLHLNVAMLPDDRLTDPAYVPRILREWNSDGLLVNYNKLLPDGLEAVIEGARVPAVWINHKRDTDACHPDDLAAGRAATRSFLALGHRRVVYCSFSYRLDSLHYSEVDRRQGYLEAMREAGAKPLVVDRYSHPVGTYAARTDVWLQLLSTPNRPTAVLAYGVTAAMSVVRAADRLGLVIPRDLSLATFAGATAYAGQDLDTWLVPEAEVGRQAVEMLLAKLAAPNEAMPSRAVPFDLGKVALADDRLARGEHRDPA